MVRPDLIKSMQNVIDIPFKGGILLVDIFSKEKDEFVMIDARLPLIDRHLFRLDLIYGIPP